MVESTYNFCHVACLAHGLNLSNFYLLNLINFAKETNSIEVIYIHDLFFMHVGGHDNSSFSVCYRLTTPYCPERSVASSRKF